MEAKDIDSLLDELINEIKNIDSNNHLNERYLHHIFSHKLQSFSDKYIVSLSSVDGLHPEWSTFITGIKERKGGKYKKDGKEYKAANSNEGSSGYIDFAIGNANKPDYAIEFKMSNNLDKEGVIFDYMKLMDSKNPFEKSFSVVIYYGRNRHSKNCEIDTLVDCYNKAKNRLNDKSRFAEGRLYRFVLIEVIDGNIKTFIESNKNGKFDYK